MPVILLLDNYDSFTFNLKALITSVSDKYSVKVKRNRDKSVFDDNFNLLVISPGPMTWNETGVLKELFNKKIIPEKIPVLGICLGMQFLAGYYGIEIGMINNPVHGSRASVIHNGDKLFSGMPEEFLAARYNSLGMYEDESDDLDFIAFEKDSNTVMALKHKTLPFAGFQFHPESFLTEHGHTLIKNYMELYVEDR